jgi:Xaa-Pro aminopeptidase
MTKEACNVKKEELIERASRFCAIMDEEHPDWETAFIIDKVNQYYFTGTMQDGMLVIKRNRQSWYFVHRSIERAKEESGFQPILPMESYRDAALLLGGDCGAVYIETDIVTIAIYERLKKHFIFKTTGSLDKAVLRTRMVKSHYEIECMEHAGKLHDSLLIEKVPLLLREGISEADFAAEVYQAAVQFGHHGIARFSMFQTEMIPGEIGFGESSLHPTNMDGPGGARGNCHAAPILGSRERLLRKGDLVFVDIGFGFNGYHTDKTQVYLFGGALAAEAAKAHHECLEIEKRLAEQLTPGSIPSEIYRMVIDGLSDSFKIDFMGFGARTSKFLGHGIGLHIDEPPIIAKGFDQPLAANMVMALEPKKGVPPIGMVGVEDTYIVTAGQGRCITGGGRDIIIV